MKNVSNEYKTIAESLDGSARYYHQILVDGVELTDTIVEFKYSHTCNNSTNFSLGNTASAMVEFKIDEPSINLENKEIQVNQGLKLADGSAEYVKLGKFKVLSPEIERFQANYQCVDAMTYAMATVYESVLTYPTTDIAILEEICQQVGIELANDNLVAHTIDKKLDNYTKREIIGFIAQLQGKNAIINTDGKLELIWYTQTDYVVDDNRIYSDRTDIIKNENDYVLGYIKSTYGSKEIVSGDINTQGIKITNPYMTQDILNEVFDKIKGLTFRAINVDFYGDFRLEVGDIVTVNTNNESYVVPVMTLEQSSDGGVITTIESIGETATQNSVDTNGGILNEIKRSVVNSETARSIAEQASDKISFVVEGDTASEFTVTENVIQATTEKLIIKTDKGGEVVIENGIMYVNDIFAEEITATGSITGAKLYGATGEFEGDIASYGTVTLYTGAINSEGKFVKDAGKIVLKATNRKNSASDEVIDVLLTFSSHNDDDNKTIFLLDNKNKLLLKGGDENGIGSAVIQFGYSADGSMGGTYYYEGGTKLSIKSEFAYKTLPGNTYNYVDIPSPHIERLMLDDLAVKNNYTENLIATDSAKMPFLSKNDNNTHVVCASNNGSLTSSSITSTELYRLLGVTSNIQDQLNAITKALAIGYENSGYKTVSMSSGTLTNVASVSLSAGTWLVVGGIRYTPSSSGVTLSNTELSIHTNTTAMNTNPTNYAKQQESEWASGTSALNATTIVTISTKTTYYLNGRVYTSGSGDNVSAYGRLFAIRIPTM